MVFEGLIPLIWTVIFICGAWSAYMVWESDPGSNSTWIMMGIFLLLEIFTIAYTPVMFRLRSLKVGTIIGATGFIICVFIIIAVLPISPWAALLLLPYLLWSPIGTFTTWEMVNLNPFSE